MDTDNYGRNRAQMDVASISGRKIHFLLTDLPNVDTQWRAAKRKRDAGVEGRVVPANNNDKRSVTAAVTFGPHFSRNRFDLQIAGQILQRFGNVSPPRVE